MGKYEREQKRKDQRKAIRDAERREKEKPKKVKTWRKDGKGNYIYKGWLKFSIPSLFVLAFVILVLAAIAYAGLHSFGLIPDANAEHAVDEDGNPFGIQYIAILPPTFEDAPTIEDLMPFDTSDQRVSGFFLQDENGTWYRDEPRYEKHWKWYYPYFLGKTVVLVDPDLTPHLLEGVHITTIKIHEHVKCCFSSQAINGTTWHIEKRFVDRGCTEAVIEFENWEFLLEDTIHYMANHCDRHLKDMENEIEEIQSEIKDHKTQKSNELWEERQMANNSDYPYELDERIEQISLEYDEQILALEEQLATASSFTEIETKVITKLPQKDTYKVPKSYVHNYKMVKLGEWCKDKYPCVYVWDEYDWVLQVGKWYDQDLISHDQFDIFLAYAYDHKIISEIPPHD